MLDAYTELSFIAFQQPDPKLSDQLMRPVLPRGDGRMTSSRVLIDEAIPGGDVWAYAPTNLGVECVAYQWGRIMNRNCYPDIWTLDVSEAPADWQEAHRFALVPMIGTWHWPMGMNQQVLHAIRKTRSEPNRIREDRQLQVLGKGDSFVMVHGVRGNSYGIVRERRQRPKWMPCQCLLILTEQGSPLIDPDPVRTMERFLGERTGQVVSIRDRRKSQRVNLNDQNLSQESVSDN